MWERLLLNEELCPRKEILDWSQKRPERPGAAGDMMQEKDR